MTPVMPTRVAEVPFSSRVPCGQSIEVEGRKERRGKEGTAFSLPSNDRRQPSRSSAVSLRECQPSRSSAEPVESHRFARGADPIAFAIVCRQPSRTSTFAKVNLRECQPSRTSPSQSDLRPRGQSCSCRPREDEVALRGDKVADHAKTKLFYAIVCRQPSRTSPFPSDICPRGRICSCPQENVNLREDEVALADRAREVDV